MARCFGGGGVLTDLVSPRISVASRQSSPHHGPAQRRAPVQGGEDAEGRHEDRGRHGAAEEAQARQAGVSFLHPEHGGH